jgi:hypothetical protein
VNFIPSHFNRHTFLAVLIVFIGLGLRLWNLGQIPPRGETADEYAWIFLGSSLIQEHKPIAWSYFPYPQHEDRTIQDMYFPIVEPAMDHPPAFSFIPGLVQTASGQTWDNPLPLFWLRLPMIGLSLLTMILLYRWALTWMDSKAALLTLALYAISPTTVLGNRMILAENLLTPLVLGQLLLLDQPLRSRWAQWGVQIINFLHPLTKIAALVFSFAHMVTLATEKRWRELLIVLASVFFGVAVLVYYVSLFDPEQFLKIQILQGSFRHTTFLTTLLAFFGKPKAIDTVFFDGLLTAAKFAFIALAFHLPEKLPAKRMYIFSLTYILFLAATVGEWVQSPGTGGGHGSYGWYWYPLYPFLFSALGYVLWQVIHAGKRAAFLILSLFFILQLRLVFLYSGWVTLGQGGIPDVVVLATLGVVGAQAFLPIKLWQKTSWAIVVIVLLASIASILFFNEGAYFQEANYFTVI